ncbi:MAG: HD domain-containing phosphohydrolase [Dehalococcoidia bacterium]|nr:HD domain-containing phosphohydrolase [Dehalococcoidia bacterium]
MVRFLAGAAILWTAASFGLGLLGMVSVEWGSVLPLVASLAATAFLTLAIQSREKHGSASLVFIIGFALSVSIAVWQFGSRVPEVHLGYLIPIALAATLWGSRSGTIAAFIVWVGNVWVVANQPGGGPLQYSANALIGLVSLGAAYFAVAMVVGRYAENLIDALSRAEQKAREALEAERQARANAEELEDAYVQTVLALAKAVEAKDTDTADHAERLAVMSERLAGKLGVEDSGETRALRFGAILHDVGKIGVPDSVLKKPGKLDPDEWELMKQHPAIGCRIVQAVARLQFAGKIVRHHHERWDGKGYPDGLSGEAIPLGARIVTVVDSYCAILEPRVYKPPRNPSVAVAELKRGAGTQFDPRIVAAFLEMLQEADVPAMSPTPAESLGFPSPPANDPARLDGVSEMEVLNQLTAVKVAPWIWTKSSVRQRELQWTFWELRPIEGALRLACETWRWHKPGGRAGCLAC